MFLHQMVASKVSLKMKLGKSIKLWPIFINSSNFISPDMSTRRHRVLLKLAHNRTKFKRRSLENSIVRTCNWLKMLDLIPQNMKNLTENAAKNFIDTIAHTYVSNNTEDFDVYFCSPYRCLQHVFFLFFFHRVALSFSYLNWLFFGLYVGSEDQDLIVEPKSFFFVLSAISLYILFGKWFCYRQ